MTKQGTDIYNEEMNRIEQQAERDRRANIVAQELDKVDDGYDRKEIETLQNVLDSEFPIDADVTVRACGVYRQFARGYIRAVYTLVKRPL